MKRKAHLILNTGFVLGWILFGLLQLYYLIPSLATQCVFLGGHSVKPADVSYVVFIFYLFLSLIAGTILLRCEKGFFRWSLSQKMKTLLLNVLLWLVWGYAFYVGTKQLSGWLEIAPFECLM